MRGNGERRSLRNAGKQERKGLGGTLTSILSRARERRKNSAEARRERLVNSEHRGSGIQLWRGKPAGAPGERMEVIHDTRTEGAGYDVG